MSLNDDLEDVNIWIKKRIGMVYNNVKIVT